MKIQQATSGESTQPWNLPFTWRSDSLQTEEKSNPMEQGKWEAVQMDSLPENPSANIYESPLGQAKDHTTPST
jgi:hypothetical protein